MTLSTTMNSSILLYSFNQYRLNETSGLPKVPLLTVNFLAGSLNGPRKQFPLSADNLGPFSYSSKDLKTFMKDVKSWEIGFEITNRFPEFGIS